MRPKLLTQGIMFALQYEQFVHDQQQLETVAPTETPRLHIAEGDEDLFNATVTLPAVQP